MFVGLFDQFILIFAQSFFDLRISPFAQQRDLSIFLHDHLNSERRVSSLRSSTTSPYRHSLSLIGEIEDIQKIVDFFFAFNDHSDVTRCSSLEPTPFSPLSIERMRYLEGETKRSSSGDEGVLIG